MEDLDERKAGCQVVVWWSVVRITTLAVDPSNWKELESLDHARGRLVIQPCPSSAVPEMSSRLKGGRYDRNVELPLACGSHSRHILLHLLHVPPSVQVFTTSMITAIVPA